MSELFITKPLEWERQSGNPQWLATPLPGLTYEIGWIGNSAFAWCVKNAGKVNECASPEEGKRLAEEHWRNYIKQALIPVDGLTEKETK